MKCKRKQQAVSIFLCLCFLISIFAQLLPGLSVAAVDATVQSVDEIAAFENKQAVFGWWSGFTLASDVDNIPGVPLEVVYEDIITDTPVVVELIGYHYDDVNGEHWYKVGARSGETLPTKLVDNPWVLYATDADIELVADPYLNIYEMGETIRFVTSETKEYEVDEKGDLVLGQDGEPIVINNLINYYVLSGPAELQYAEIEITPRDSEYPISALAYTETTYGTTFSKAFDIIITKSNGDLWGAADGQIAIRYEAAQFGSDTYTEDVFGAGYLYVNDQIYSSAVTDRFGYDESDVVYTNSGSSVIVFECLPSDFELVCMTGYFVGEQVVLYNNMFESITLATLPDSIDVLGYFTNGGAEYYWINAVTVSDCAYFVVSAADITFEQQEVVPPVDEPTEEALTIYNELKQITTWEAWEEYWESLNEESREALSTLPQDKLEELEELDGYFSHEKFLSMAPPAVNYLDAEPLVPRMTYQPAEPVMFKSVAPRYRAIDTFDLASTPSIASEAENGLILDKGVEKNGDVYTITLEAYTTGTVTPGDTIPNDIILVLDLSTSMTKDFAEVSYTYTAAYPTGNYGTYYLENGQEVEYCTNCRSWTYGCSYWIRHYASTKVTPKTSASDTTSGSVQFYTRSGGKMNRLDALQSAMSAFVSQVADQSSADRIALVGFHTQGVLLYGNSDASALVDATANEAALLNAINGIDDNDLGNATEHGRGMERAVAVFNAQTGTDYSNRNKVVIMVTDGEPAPSGTNNWSSRTVKQAIEQSYILKNTHQATVYSVSVMPGTDASNPTTNMDRYMDYMSSNYPSADYPGNSRDDEKTSGDSYYSGSTDRIIGDIVPGDKIETEGSYYLTAGDMEALTALFGNIAEQTGGAAINLDATTQIKDIISPYFTLPSGATKNSITVSTYDADYSNGSLQWKDSTIQNFNPEVTIDGRNVTVTGFDFTRNFVAESGRVEGDVTQIGSFHGRKLVITFDIVPDPYFLGGDGVPTNGMASGVYDKNGNSVEYFSLPTTDVPLKEIENIVQDKHIYYSNSTDLTGLLDLHVKDKSTDMDLQELANGVNNAYVNLVYDITVGGNKVATYTILAGQQWNNGTWSVVGNSGYLENMQILADTLFSVSCTMISKNKTTNTSSTSGDANVFVYKPALTFKDSEVYYGDYVVLGDHLVPNSEVWTNAAKGASTSNPMEGDIPKLDIFYSYADNAIVNGTVGVNGNVNVTEDIPVNVTVKVGTQDITKVVTFVHSSCSHPGCGYKTGDEEFIIHVLLRKTSLTITKRFPDGANYAIDVNQSFLFHVNGTAIDGTSLDLMVAINGTGSVTVTDVPWGEYTVTEIDNWSWRYTPDKTSVTLNLVNSTDKYEAVFVNTRDQIYWLDGDSYCRNWWGGANGAIVRSNSKAAVIKD